MNNKRALEYEKRIKSYLFKGTLERHKEICEFLNVKPSITEPDYKKAYDILMEYWDSLPDEEKPIINKQLEKLGL